MKPFFKFIILITTIFYSLISQAQLDSLFVLEIKPIQKEILAKLTGQKAIKDNLFLLQRSTPKERRLTVDYLSDYLFNMGWELYNHHYKTTNGNPFLDLILKPMTGINVVAKLPATKTSNEYIIFGSHYDSERGSPGAIDNASGIALSLGLAHKLTDLKERKVNFIIVFFDQEEDNEIGSKAYAKLLKKSGREVHSVHTIDMMGWDKDDNRGFEIELPTLSMQQLYETEVEKFNIPLSITKVSSSDHKSFIDQGFNAVGISEEYVKRDTTPYIHTPNDTYDTVNFNFLISTTQIIYQIFKKLAQ
ncbi:M28 family peptidase [Flavobacteriaceae bacterium AU392]|nr:Zn-dependent exopeptidase M28 [Flavobacteriaceae bacterium]RKM83581.1 M28 family peptidase [Flavobacteriaceae bacterium AU392]